MVAYILYSNDLVDEDFVLSQETFLDVEMPNAEGFIVDDRIETEHSLWVGEPCMSNCKPAPVEVTMRAMVLDVTPQEETAEQAAAEPVEEAAAAPVAEPAVAAVDPALVEQARRSSRNARPAIRSARGPRTAPGRSSTGSLGALPVRLTVSSIPAR